MTLQEEVLAALADGSLLHSHQITKRIEDVRLQRRFLFWHYTPVVGTGSLFLALDQLRASGEVMVVECNAKSKAYKLMEKSFVPSEGLFGKQR